MGKRKVRSTTSLGTLVMGFNETKYVSKKPLQFESTLYKNALCQNSAFDLSGLTHSDSFLCFPIVLLWKTMENKGKIAILVRLDLKQSLNQ